MYTIQKTQAFTDTITFENGGGQNGLTIQIQLKITPELASQYRTIQLRLISLQKQIQADPSNSETISEIGECIVRTFSLLFGEENTKEIVRFYENDLDQMLLDVFPYIQNVIVPEIGKIAKARKQQFRKRF